MIADMLWHLYPGTTSTVCGFTTDERARTSGMNTNKTYNVIAKWGRDHILITSRANNELKKESIKKLVRSTKPTG